MTSKKKLFAIFLTTIFSLHGIGMQDIEHVVVLMLENRSFDNLLGWLYSEKKPQYFIPSDHPLPFQGFSNEMLNSYINVLKNSSGETIFSSPPIQGIPSTMGSKLINSPETNPNEPFDHVTKQIFGFEGGDQPSMLGFLQDYASLWEESDWLENRQAICSVMESYTFLPVFHGLARHYAVSDLWFSSVPTQTNPNRAFLACGTSDGQIVNGCLGQSTFQADTIWNRLETEASGTSWTIFWQADRLPCLPGPFTGPQTFPALNCIPHLDQHYQRLDVFHELARQGKLPDFSFIEPQWTFIDAIHLEQLKENDPNSEFLAGIQGNDMHPPGDVRTAENLLANIYTSLIANPEAWKKTLFVVLFDEHGGIFDHVSPPAALAPDDHFECGFTFNRYGVRIPALFISPLIQKGTVIRSSSPLYPFDHTSLIGTLLKWKGVDPAKWNMGARTAAAPTFEGVITKSIPRNDPILAPSNLATQGNESLNMGDAIVLKDPKGNYLSVSTAWDCSATVRSDASTPLQLDPSGGKITHGSFVLIRLNDPSLSDEYVLDSASLIGDCYYTKNSHNPGQWWTIKSVDFPYLGYEIKPGDRVYLECHVYLDPLRFVPARLSTRSGWIWGESVTTKAIIDEDAVTAYWVIEKGYSPEK